MMYDFQMKIIHCTVDCHQQARGVRYAKEVRAIAHLSSQPIATAVNKVDPQTPLVTDMKREEQRTGQTHSCRHAACETRLLWLML